MKLWLAIALAVLAAGCAQEAREDGTATDSVVSTQTMPMDSSMPMGHDMDAGMMRMMMEPGMMMDSAGGTRNGRMMAAAKDADQMFLRMMSDHHEGLIRMAMQAMDKGSTEAVKADAHALHTKQAAERDSMVAMLRKDYQDQHQVMAPRMNSMQADSLSKASGTEYDRNFYRMVVDHHRMGIMMIDHLMPRMKKPAVRQMAEKMKADQTREIQELQQKMS